MTTKHTPGPWRTICPPSMSADSRFIFGENDEWIASIHQRQGMQQEESLSNARLIAAAPELLEALQTILNHSTSGVLEVRETGKPTIYTVDEISKIARAAIAKATQ